MNRDVLIYMNHPLRYRGETFYQAGFRERRSGDDLTGGAQPDFIAPYLACIIVAIGLLDAIRFSSRWDFPVDVAAATV